MKSLISNWVLKHPAWVLIMSLGLLIASASGLKHLRLSIDYEYFFGADNPELIAYNDIKSLYTDTDNLVLVVVPDSGTVFENDTLALVEALTEKAAFLPYANRVDSITNFQHSVAEEDSMEVNYLVEEAQFLTQSQINEIEHIALTEPQLANFLQASNGQSTAVVATFNLPNESPAEIAEIVTKAKEFIAELAEQYPNAKVKPIGLTMLSYTYGEASRADMKTLTPLMFLLVIILVAVLTRSAWSTLLSFVVILSTIMAALGCFSWLRIPLTTVTAVAPTIIMAVVVAHVVHIIEVFYQQWQSGTNKEVALKRSMEINFAPIFITSLTTIIGFLSMNFNDVPPYRDLGNLIAMAVIFAFIFSLFTLPAALKLLPVRPRKAKLYESKFEKLGTWVLSRRGPILIVATFLLGTSLWLIPQNELNEKFVEQFDQRFEYRRDNDYFTDNISGIYSVEYSIKSISNSIGSDEEAIANPRMLKTIDEFVIWLRSQPEVRHVLSITDVFKRLNKNMHGDQSEWYTLPDNQQLASQYLLLYSMSLPLGLDLNNQLTTPKDATRIVVRFDDMPSSELIKTDERIQDWWTKYSSEYEVTGASTSLMFTHIVKRAVDSMVGGTLIAFLIISIVLMLALKSIKLGLISLIPNILPICFGIGVWTLINGEIGMSFAIVVVLTLGIIVDDTVHFLSKYQYAKTELGLSNNEAIQHSFKTVGIALTTTTIALVTGFAVLTLSGFARNADMGLMAAITVLLALIIDLLVLPALLKSKSPKAIQEVSYE